MIKQPKVKKETDDRIPQYAIKNISDIFNEFGCTTEGMPDWQVVRNREKDGVNRIFSKEKTQ
ncbi:MAG: hypothetical protein ACRCSQ_08375 [Bacteroidales bacterium]